MAVWDNWSADKKNRVRQETLDKQEARNLWYTGWAGARQTASSQLSQNRQARAERESELTPWSDVYRPMMAKRADSGMSRSSIGEELRQKATKDYGTYRWRNLNPYDKTAGRIREGLAQYGQQKAPTIANYYAGLRRQGQQSASEFKEFQVRL